MKKRMHVSECTDEYILAENILNSHGAVILPMGSIINGYVSQKLIGLGIYYVLVSKRNENDDPVYGRVDHFEKKYKELAGELQHLIRGMVNGKKLDYEKLNKLTNSVMASNEDAEHILQYLGRIREADQYTYYHSLNVSFYAMLIGGWLNLARADIKIIVQAGLMHDLGKTRIPSELLNKKEKLSSEEFEEIKRHSIYGYELVKDNPDISQEVKDVILMHHEREDKSGYPLGIGADDLSIYTKIVSVADVYDAMTSNRSYRKALTAFEAFEEFHTVCRGRMDTHIINTLLHNLSRFYIGKEVVLNNGKTGRIAYIPPHCMWRPVIDTESGFIDLFHEQNLSVTCFA